MIYDINTIANYDPAIIDYLEMGIGSELKRIEDSNSFELL